MVQRTTEEEEKLMGSHRHCEPRIAGRVFFVAKVNGGAA